MSADTTNKVTQSANAGTSRAAVGGELPDLLPPGPGVFRKTLRSRPFNAVVAVVLVIAGWYGLIWVFNMPPYTLPTPHAVLATLVTEHALLWDSTLVTAQEIFVAFLLATAIGIPVGILIAFSSIAERIIYPILVAAQAVPKVALAPILLAWFGFGFTTNLMIGLLIAFFPIVVNTVLGLSSIDPDFVRLGRTLGGSKLRLFWRIRLPTALPTIFSGLKVAASLATIGAIVGEFVAGNAGLGYLVSLSMGYLNTALAFAAVVCVSLLGVIVFLAVEALERVVLRAHPHVQRR